MVRDQGDKLFKLALDIVTYGFNPLDTIGVYPSKTYKDYFEVGEGNRRMCALKLLISPERLKHINNNLYSKFILLANKYEIPDLLEVGVFDDEFSMRHWMEIRHMGEQGGKGLAKWNSSQKARFNRMQTGSDALLDFWDWMIAQNIFTEDEILSVTKTNWQRVLREKYFPFLKIQYAGNYVVLLNDIKTFTERIKSVQQNLAGKTVAIVYDQEKIEEFYNLISNSLYGKPYQEVINEESEQAVKFSFDNSDIIDKSKENTIQDISLFDDINDDIDVDLGIKAKISNENNVQSIGKDVFNGSVTIIPYGYSIRTENMRLNKIIYELKRISADDYPNACGTLLRTLFELSAKVYLEKQGRQDCTEIEFAPAIKNAANQLLFKGCINKNQHSAINSDIDNLRRIFNGYMHNTDSYPSSESLKNFFKCHRVFIQECLK